MGHLIDRSRSLLGVPRRIACERSDLDANGLSKSG